MEHTSKNAESRKRQALAGKNWQPQQFQMMIKATGLSNAFLLDYDGSNSFPSIVKGIIETTQKVRGAYPT